MRKILFVFLALVALCCVVSAYTAFPWCSYQDLFFRNDSSDITGYKVLDQVPQIASETAVYTSVSSATGSKTIASFVSPYGSPGIKTLAPGLWRFRTYFNVSSAVGVTTYEFLIYNRSSTGVETNLFYGHAISQDINSLQPTEYLMSYARRNYTTFFNGDRLVIKINASTTSVTARDAWITLAGNLHASEVQVSYWVCQQQIGGGVVGGGGNTTNELPLPDGIAIIGCMVAVAIIAFRKR